jgi:hypothetical protein
VSSGSMIGSGMIGVGGAKSQHLPHASHLPHVPRLPHVPHLPRLPLGLGALVLVGAGGALIVTLLIVTTLMTIAGVGGYRTGFDGPPGFS